MAPKEGTSPGHAGRSPFIPRSIFTGPIPHRPSDRRGGSAMSGLTVINHRRAAGSNAGDRRSPHCKSASEMKRPVLNGIPAVQPWAEDALKNLSNCGFIMGYGHRGSSSTGRVTAEIKATTPWSCPRYINGESAFVVLRRTFRLAPSFPTNVTGRPAPRQGRERGTGHHVLGQQPPQRPHHRSTSPLRQPADTIAIAHAEQTKDAITIKIVRRGQNESKYLS